MVILKKKYQQKHLIMLLNTVSVVISKCDVTFNYFH